MESAAATTKPSVEIFWQARPVKYNFPGKAFSVEEVKTPWDLYVEGRYFDSPVGDELHQMLVRNGVERIFSIRTAKGTPQCDIICLPEGAPAISLAYALRRVFKTSYPMEVDGQKLIVCDVTAGRGSRATDQMIKFAEDFYLSNGGRLRGEHPNGFVYAERSEIRRWRRVLDQDIQIDLMISSKPIKEATERPDFEQDTMWAPNAEIAIALLQSRYWRRCYINGEDEWSAEIVDYMDANIDDMPYRLVVCGHNDHSKMIYNRVKILCEKEPPAKK